MASRLFNMEEMNDDDAATSGAEGGLCNPSLPEDCSFEIEKIKGDAIGDTLYSERSVLKTLIKLTQYTEESWSEDFETEVCLLWDMCLEKDVVDFVVKNDFLEISAVIIQSSSNVRLIEILVGIHGNISCVLKSDFPRNHLLMMLEILYTSSDPPTLIQVLRLIQAVSWRVSDDYWLDSYPINKLASQIAFLLTSSTNDELLMCCIELLNTLCRPSDDKDYSHFFSTPILVHGLLECWKQLYGNWAPPDDFLSKAHEKASFSWCSILASFTTHQPGIAALCEHGASVGDITSKLCTRACEWDDSILPLCIAVLEAVVKCFFSPPCFVKILKLFNSANQVDETPEIESSLGYFVESVGSYFESIATNVESPVLQETLSHCNENHVLLFWKTVDDRAPDPDVGQRAL